MYTTMEHDLPRPPNTAIGPPSSYTNELSMFPSPVYKSRCLNWKELGKGGVGSCL